MSTQFSITSLPDEVLDMILSYISYDEVSRIRLVCKRFDVSAQRTLNHGFYKVEKYHAYCHSKVKELLPRRESERRKHPLAMHCDILTAIKTRLSLLRMTYIKHVDLKQCCFIPGKVLDEIFKILRLVSGNPVSPRSYEVLQELRDISSMAMEHFDEKIAPALRKAQIPSSKLVTENGSPSASVQATFSKPKSSQQLAADYRQFIIVRNGYRHLHSKYLQLSRKNILRKKQMMDCRKQLNDVDRDMHIQNAIIMQHSLLINEHRETIEQLTMNFVELDKAVAYVLSQSKSDCPSCVQVPKPEEAFAESRKSDVGNKTERESSDTLTIIGSPVVPKKKMKK